MDLINRFRGGDIFFPDTEGFLGSGRTGIFDEPEGIAASGGGTHDVGRTEAGLYELSGHDGLDNRFTAASAKHKQALPVLIGKMVGHADSPAWFSTNACRIHAELCCSPKKLLDMSRRSTRRLLDLFL